MLEKESQPGADRTHMGRTLAPWTLLFWGEGVGGGGGWGWGVGGNENYKKLLYPLFQVHPMMAVSGSLLEKCARNTSMAAVPMVSHLLLDLPTRVVPTMSLTASTLYSAAAPMATLLPRERAMRVALESPLVMPAVRTLSTDAVLIAILKPWDQTGRDVVWWRCPARIPHSAAVLMGKPLLSVRVMKAAKPCVNTPTMAVVRMVLQKSWDPTWRVVRTRWWRRPARPPPMAAVLMVRLQHMARTTLAATWPMWPQNVTAPHMDVVWMVKQWLEGHTSRAVRMATSTLSPVMIHRINAVRTGRRLPRDPTLLDAQVCSRQEVSGETSYLNLSSLFSQRFEKAHMVKPLI